MCSFLTGVQSCALPILFSILRSGVLWCRKLAASDQSSLVLSRTLAFARHFGTRGNLLPTSAGLSGLRVTSASIHEALASSDNPSIRTFSADTIRSAPQVRTLPILVISELCVRSPVTESGMAMVCEKIVCRTQSEEGSVGKE